jgi:hypothetical protein
MQRQGNRMLADRVAVHGVFAVAECPPLGQRDAVLNPVTIANEATNLLLALPSDCDGVGAGAKAFHCLLKLAGFDFGEKVCGDHESYPLCMLC